MKILADNVDAYIDQTPADRQEALTQLRQVIQDNLPEGFAECIGYNMPSYVVPHDLYPGGYQCDPKLPLPFLSFANQKNFVALYHMGLYASDEIMAWFLGQWDAEQWGKLDMGKSCIRFKKMDRIPFQLVGKLVSRMGVEDWIHLYESKFRKG